MHFTGFHNIVVGKFGPTEALLLFALNNFISFIHPLSNGVFLVESNFV
jgi:hypothetical protein